jgi:hypothetical protein
MAQPVSLVTTDDLPLGTSGNPLPVINAGETITLESYRIEIVRG